MERGDALDGLDLGALLHAWRDRLAPVDAGITPRANRRAPGLRREELAELAGVSVDYVLRLEQGRATTPSAQVVTALARALQLSRRERDQLFRAAGLLPPLDDVVSTHVPASIQRLAASMGGVPIGIFAADWSLLWANSMWTALHGDPAELPPEQRNLARVIFSRGRDHDTLHATRSAGGPDSFEAAIVADLKDVASRYPADLQLRRLVNGLMTTSPAFSELWRASAPAAHASDRKTVQHPVVGAITLDCDVLNVPGGDLHLVTYTAPAGSDDASKLDLLRVTHGRRLTPTTPPSHQGPVHAGHDEEGRPG